MKKVGIIQEQLIAQIALQLKSFSKLQGDVPSDEDLAALYDDKLDSLRRSEVLSHLSQNNELYHRWLRFIELQGNYQSYESMASSLVKRDGIIYRIRNFLASMQWNTPQLMGSAAAIVFMVLLIPYLMNPSQDPNGTNQWNDELNSRWQTEFGKNLPQLPSKSISRAKSNVRKIIETGYRMQLLEFDEQMIASAGIEMQRLSEKNPRSEQGKTAEQVRMLTLLGRLSALAYFQCKIDRNSDWLNKYKQILKESIQTKNLDSEMEEIKNKYNSNEYSICQVSNHIFDWLVHR